MEFIFFFNLKISLIWKNKQNRVKSGINDIIGKKDIN